MESLPLEATDDLVKRLAREDDPIRAVIELIWNSLDAEATSIEVTVKKDGLDGIESISIVDNGLGIEPELVKTAFGKMGDSWKARVRGKKTPNKVRFLHGSLGQGRLRAFALGQYIEWVSPSQTVDGEPVTVHIVGNSQNRKLFQHEVSPRSGGDYARGTRFMARSSNLRRVLQLETDRAREAVTAAFAPVLLDEPDLNITYLDKRLDVSDQIEADTKWDREVEVDAGVQKYELRVIQWKRSKRKAICYAATPGRVVYEQSGKDIEKRFNFSAHITWPAVLDHLSELPLGDQGPTPVREVVSDAHQQLQNHFSKVRRVARKQRLDKWKSDQIYPFKGAPKTETERVERVLFDVVSGTLSDHISTDESAARLTLTLLQNALKHEPGHLLSILHEIVNLEQGDRARLAELIESVSMSGIVKAAAGISDRSRLLVALDHIIYDPHDSRLFNERDNLHKILEGELWIFGEQYNYMRSERGLTEALRTHLRLSGLHVPSRLQPVRQPDGRSGRLDLHLAVKSEEHERKRHLVIELKDPNLELDRTHLDQVKDYANTILDEPRFADSNSQWDFILVGRSIDRAARREVQAGHEGSGLFLDPPRESSDDPHVRCYVRTWRSVIDDNTARLKFYRDALEDDPSVEDSLAYLRKVHAAALPDRFTGPAA